MQTSKIISKGNHQIILLPKKFHFLNINKISIRKSGNKIILEPIINSWEPLLKGINMINNDLELQRDTIIKDEDNNNLF